MANVHCENYAVYTHKLASDNVLCIESYYVWMFRLLVIMKIDLCLFLITEQSFPIFSVKAAL